MPEIIRFFCGMKDYFFEDFLRSNLQLTPGQRDILFEHSVIKEYDRGDFILSAGETCTHRFFIERGAIREYSIDPKGKEHLLFFAVEGWFLMNVDSVFFNLPSRHFIQAIEPTRLLLINENQLQRLVREDTDFADFDRRLLYEHIQMLHRRITLLQSASAEERYLEFIKDFPEVPLRVPQSMIASYLGITPESLSRIRRELAGRNSKGSSTS